MIKSTAELPNPWIVHGTYFSALEDIKRQGLSRMSRVHIHFCPYEPTDNRVISGVRRNVEVLVYVNVDKALKGRLSGFILALKIRSGIHMES